MRSAGRAHVRIAARGIRSRTPCVRAAARIRLPRSHAQTRAVRSDRTRRAAYDSALSNGQLRYNPELEQEKKVEADAARGTTPNGRRYFTLHLEAERAGDVVKAHANLKTALTFEPKNAAFKAKLDALEAELKALRKKNPGHQIGHIGPHRTRHPAHRDLPGVSLPQ